MLLGVSAYSMEPHSSRQSSLVLAQQALEAEKWDEAIAHYITASHQGLSRDSLLYFLAETSLQKGASDTALVFNLAIQPKPDSPLLPAVIGQRMKIYGGLGMNEEVTRLRDSLQSPFRRAVKPWLPRGSARLGSGYTSEGMLEARPEGTSESLSQGPSHRMDASLEWSLGLGNFAQLEIEGGYKVFQAYYRDSLKRDLGVDMRLVRLWERLHAGYGFRVIGNETANPLQSRIGSQLHRGDLSLVSPTVSGLHFANLGYEREVHRNGRRDHEMFWLMYYWDASISTGRGLALTLMFNGYFADPQYLDMFKVIFVESGLSGRTTHYTSREFEDLVPGNRFNVAQNSLKDYSVGENQVSTFNHYSVGIAPSYAWPLGTKWDLSAQIGVATFYFPKAYVWSSASPDAVPVTVAFSRLEESYFRVDEAEIGGDNPFGDSLQVFKRKRTDVSTEFRMTFTRKLARWGALEFRSQGRYTISNFAAYAPVRIPRWEVGIGIDWRNKWEFL